MIEVVCYVCAKSIPSALKNAHHAKPQAAGGGPDDLVDLCAGDHANLHAIASMLGGPRASQAEDTVRAYYRDDLAAGKRCLELAFKVVRHMAEKTNGQYTVKPHEDVEILLEIPAAVKQALALMGREARDPQSNRRLGMAGAARHILIDAVLRKFPSLKQQIHQASLDSRKNPDAAYARPKRRISPKEEL